MTNSITSIMPGRRGAQGSPATALVVFWLTLTAVAGDPAPPTAPVPAATPAPTPAPTPATTVAVNKVALDGQLDSERARLVIEADLKGLTGRRERTIYGAAVQHGMGVSREKLTHVVSVQPWAPKARNKWTSH